MLAAGLNYSSSHLQMRATARCVSSGGFLFVVFLLSDPVARASLPASVPQQPALQLIERFHPSLRRGRMQDEQSRAKEAGTVADPSQPSEGTGGGCAKVGCILGLMLLGPLGPLLFPAVFPVLLACTPRPRSVRRLPWWLLRAAFHALGGPFLAVMFYAEEVAGRQGRDKEHVLIELLGGRAPDQEEQS